MKYLILVLLIVIFVSCDPADIVPDEAILIERLDPYWSVYEIRGQLFLIGFNGGNDTSMMTRLDEWPMREE